VGTYFLRNYYNLLQQNPDVVHQFYNEASTMIRVDDVTGISTTANSMMVCVSRSIYLSCSVVHCYVCPM
jgi:hypothetical protein